MRQNRYQLQRINLFYIGIEMIWIAIIFILYSGYNSGITRWLIWIVLIHFYLLFSRNIFSSSSLERGTFRLISLKNLFFISAYLVFLFPYQLYVLNLLDIENSSFLLSKTYSEYSNPAVLLTSLLLSSFSLGWEIASNRSWGNSKNLGNDSDIEFDKELSSILIVGLMLIIPSYLFSGVRSVAEQRYQGGTGQGVLAEALYFTATLLCMIASSLWVYLKMKSMKISTKMRFVILLSLFWQFRLLYVGDRNSFFLLAIIQLVGYGYFVRRPNLPTLVTVSATAIYLYLIIENFRAQKVKTLDSFISLGRESKFSILSETSLNITTISVRASLSMVEESKQFFYGLFKLIGLLGVIPFSRGILLPDSVRVADTSQLVTEYIFGENPNWQVGTSLIADSYIDFGIMGVAIISFFYGFLGGVFQYKAKQSRTLWDVIFHALLLSLYFQLPRYSADFPVRYIVWTWLLVVVAKRLATSSKKSGRDKGG